MFANLRTGMGWLRSAVAWRVVEGVLSAYQGVERVFKKLHRPGRVILRR